MVNLAFVLEANILSCIKQIEYSDSTSQREDLARSLRVGSVSKQFSNKMRIIISDGDNHCTNGVIIETVF